jgi:NTE family protein
MSKPAINLALQGGGAHGAFTWGVLDRLLEADVLEIAAISGASAGALNGAAVKAGFAKRGGGAEAARENLDWLWEQVGAINDPMMLPWLTAFSPGLMSKTIEHSLPFALSESMGRMSSPYDSGAFYRNALEPIVARFHYDEVCGAQGPELHICATNVRSGKIRVFTGAEVGPDPIMASACLPTMFRAVEIWDPKTERKEAYWDGGYTGNPALFPLFRNGLPRDIVIVNINPLHREDLPTTARDIQNRINEISFNSSLLRELRAIQYVKDLLAEGAITQTSKKDVLVHMIADDALMTQLSVATKVMPNAVVLAQLKQAGRAATDRFLDAHEADVGTRSSVDLAGMFS